MKKLWLGVAMSRTKAGLIALLLFGLCQHAQGEYIPWDDALKAVDRAGKELSQGNERKEILERLNKAIDDNPQSGYLEQAKRLSADLSVSLKRPVTKAALPLMETTMPSHLVALSGNWDHALQKLIKEHPRDPLAVILSRDREVIELLITQLHDTSPTRGYYDTGVTGDIPRVPRVCDMALLAIEFHSQCRFHFNVSSGKPFHELPKENRAETIRHIEKWWKENKEKPLAAGIRSQIPHADFNAKVWMAKNLANLEVKEKNPDREYAIEVLRTLVEENWGHTAAYAANALAELGDFTPLDVFYTRWKKSLAQPGRNYDSHVVWYLTDYGGRREWELLYQLARRDLNQGVLRGTNPVWPTVVNCEKANSSLFAIPGLALALAEAKDTASRHLDGLGERHTKEQPFLEPFSIANTAVERLQKLTGVDFNYRRTGSAEERAAAILKAHNWWQTEGREKYTFDAIELMMDERAQ